MEDDNEFNKELMTHDKMMIITKVKILKSVWVIKIHTAEDNNSRIIGKSRMSTIIQEVSL